MRITFAPQWLGEDFPLEPKPSTLEREAFLQAFGELYEHSAWLAAAAWERGIGPQQDTAYGLLECMAQELHLAGPARELELIRAHPELAGKAALAGEISTASSVEQASAGLDRCSAQELRQLREQVALYRQRFDFPFVMAVRGRTPAEILQTMERCLANDPEKERARAINEIHRIAYLRLQSETHRIALHPGLEPGA